MNPRAIALCLAIFLLAGAVFMVSASHGNIVMVAITFFPIVAACMLIGASRDM